MSNNKVVLLAAFGLIVMLSIMGGFVIAPNYRKAAAVDRHTLDLKNKISSLSTQSAVVQALAEDLKNVRTVVENDFKSIPDGPDIASLIRKLSQEVDRVRVLDQTFNAGTPSEAITGEKSSVQAMPLTVDMEATFDSVFALIQNVESIDRLVRVSTVRVVCKRDEKTEPDAMALPMVKASVGLEALYDPPQSSTEGR